MDRGRTHSTEVYIGNPSAKKAQKNNFETYISDEITIDSMVEKLMELKR